jgi:hypothetical protein
VTSLPRIEEGYAYAPEGPGLGLALLPEVLRRDDLTVRTSAL